MTEGRSYMGGNSWYIQQPQEKDRRDAAVTQVLKSIFKVSISTHCHKLLRAAWCLEKPRKKTWSSSSTTLRHRAQQGKCTITLEGRTVSMQGQASCGDLHNRVAHFAVFFILFRISISFYCILFTISIYFYCILFSISHLSHWQIINCVCIVGALGMPGARDKGRIWKMNGKSYAWYRCVS